MSAPLSILFITDSLPFPPRNGKELPVARFMTEMAQQGCQVDLLVLTPHNTEWAGRTAAVPETVRNIMRVRHAHTQPLAAGVEELVGGRPAFFLRGFNASDLRAVTARAPYDYVWVSPVRALGLVDHCRRHGIRLAHRVALGLNDVKTTMYLNGVAQAFTAGVGARMYQKAWRALRVPHLAWQERRYLRSSDMVHVQTGLEKSRALRICGNGGRQPHVVAVPNGRKCELGSVGYRGVDSARVLLMTHLAGRRDRESFWFLREVWPAVRARVPDARLQLVGTPPEPNSDLWRRADEGIDVVGFADALPALYDSVALAVVPVFHSTGLNNRVLDAVSAGVPLVATSHALATIDGLVSGEHAIAADDRDAFADAVAGLLQDRAARLALAERARAFGMQQLTWEQGAAELITALRAYR